MTPGTEKVDQKYLRAKAVNPTLTFSQFCMANVLHGIRLGNPHATLGANLGRPEPWTEAGRSTFARYRTMLDLRPAHSVVDLGCGSLRMGYQFIDYLDRGRYLGIELVPELLAMGRELIGKELLEAKAPTLRQQDQAAIDEASRFNADVVVSTVVAFHVHPDDTATYFSTLAHAASKPGARIIFDTKLSPKAERLGGMAWSWPLEFYERALSPLQFVKIHHQMPYATERFPDCTAGYLEFRRS